MTEGAHRLRLYLERKGLSQGAFAQRVGKSRPTVNLWVCGRYVPDLDNLMAIERETKIPIRAWAKPLNAA